MSRLERWSRRKLGEDAEAQTLAEMPSAQMDTTDRAPPPDPASEPEPGSLDATLPDPDSLAAGSDFKAFLQTGVSDALRRRALRRMFSADHYAVRDGLDDYDDDYRQQLKPLASELAQRLRQWTRPVEESESEAETVDPAVTSSVDAETEQDSAAPASAGDDNAIDNPRVAESSGLASGTALDQG